ncbi:MAG: hypothetical protein ACK5KL_19515, partial [Dysgonomonas sp.]
MKKLNLLVMLFALLVTACSDSDNEDPNGGGKGNNKENIVGLNIKDAKLIYGVDKASAKSMLKSSGSSNYFRQVTKGNQNIEVTWVTENGDTTSITAIHVMAELNADHIIVGTSQYLGDDSGLALENLGGSSYMGYIINKNTGKVINPDNPILSEYEGTGGDIDWNNFISFYDSEKHCYLNGKGYIIKVNLETSELTKMFEESDDIKIFSNGTFFVHMKDGNHKYGNFRLNTVHEFSDFERYQGWDNYIPVYGVVDGILSIICNKKNSDGTTIYTVIDYYAGNGYGDYGFSDQLDNPKYKLIADFELPSNIPIGGRVLTPISVNTSRTSQIIYIGTSNGRNGILINRNIEGLSQLPDELISGFVTGKERNTPYESI